MCWIKRRCTNKEYSTKAVVTPNVHMFEYNMLNVDDIDSDHFFYN